MLISSHLNQQFATDSIQLAGGIVLQAAQTVAMCCEKQSLSPDVCHQRDMQTSDPVMSNKKSHLVVSSSEELYHCGQTDL